MLNKEVADLLQSFELADSQTVTVTMVLPDDAGTKEPLQGLQDLNVTLMLHDNKFRKHLIADGHFIMTIQADMKAAFSVNKADDPICI